MLRRAVLTLARPGNPGWATIPCMGAIPPWVRLVRDVTPALPKRIFGHQILISVGAGEGNRTLVISLEGFCSTIELHPRFEDQVSSRPPSAVIRSLPLCAEYPERRPITQV